MLLVTEVIDDDLYISPMERGEGNISSQIIKKQMIFSITLQKWQVIESTRSWSVGRNFRNYNLFSFFFSEHR